MYANKECEECYPPVTVQVNHSHVVPEGGPQARPVQSVLHRQHGGGFPRFLQQDHSSIVIGSGGSSHHRQAATPGDAVSRIKGES